MENVFLKLCIRDQTVNSEDENNNYVANNEIIERVYVNNGNNISKDNEESVQILNRKKPSRMAKLVNKLVTKPKEEFKKALKLPKWGNLKGLIFKNSLLLRRDIG